MYKLILVWLVTVLSQAATGLTLVSPGQDGEGDQIKLVPGSTFCLPTTQERILIKAVGTSEAPITIKGCGTSPAVIHGHNKASSNYIWKDNPGIIAVRNASHIIFDNIIVQGHDVDGQNRSFYILDSDNIRLDNVIVQDNAECISIVSSSDIVLSENVKCLHNKKTNLYIDPGAGSSNISISGEYAYAGCESDGDGIGIGQGGGSLVNVDIKNAYIHDNCGTGIFIGTVHSASFEDVTIENIVIANNGRNCYAEHHFPSQLVGSLTIRNVQCSGVISTGENYAAAGFFFGNSGSTFRDILVENVVTWNNKGISSYHIDLGSGTSLTLDSVKDIGNPGGIEIPGTTVFYGVIYGKDVNVSLNNITVRDSIFSVHPGASARIAKINDVSYYQTQFLAEPSFSHNNKVILP